MQANESSSGEKANAGLVPTGIKGKLKPKYKLYSVNLDKISVTGLVSAINSEEMVPLVLRWQRTDECVTDNIQLPLTPK